MFSAWEALSSDGSCGLDCTVDGILLVHFGNMIDYGKWVANLGFVYHVDE